MIRDIESKVDKVLITEKDFQKISKWVAENVEGKCNGADNVLNKKMFFPLRTFIFETRTRMGDTKCLVELDGYNPVSGGRMTTDRWWYTWKREFRDGMGGFWFDGEGLDEKLVAVSHRYLMDCLMYICMAEREKEYRFAVEKAHKEGCEPHEYSDRVCFLLKDIIQYVSTHKTKKSVKFSCECWGVRGHIRHYQDGRTVFIEPYKKGKKRDILEPRSKTYLL